MSIILANNAKSTLAASIGALDTTLTITSGTENLFPSPTGSDYFYVTLEDSTKTIREVVKCTTRNTTTLTVVRAQDDTLANIFATGSTVEMRVNKAAITDTISGAISAAAAAAASASAAATSASNASTYATNASNSATAAANSATDATNNGAAQVALAAAQVGLATTQAGNAATSATAAAASATAAAASFDSFDDRYLGAKSSPPSVDNDGNPLLTGALYWDTSTNALNVYTGSAWTPYGNSGDPAGTAVAMAIALG